MEKLISCKICGRECKNLRCLVSHLREHKQEYSQKDYYDKFMKKDENEGKCLGVKCENKTDFIGLKKGYCKFCSPKCSNNSPQTKEKKRLKSQVHYGTDYPMQSKEVRDIGIQTNLERRGIDNIFRDVKYIEKCMIKKHGVKYATQVKKFEEKRLKTCQDKFGGPAPYCSEKVRKKGEQTNLEHCGETSIFKSKEWQEKNKLIMIEKHGVDNIFRDVEYIKKCTFNKLGVNNVMELKEVVNKIKQTRIKNGTMLPDNQCSYFKIYYRLIYYFTNLSLKKKFSKEELEKRKLNGTDGGIQVDHKFSVVEGFKQNILPCIIGSQSNLELLTWEDNCKKKSKCSITKEELFELYEQETKRI